MEGSIALLGFGEGGWGPSIASGVLVTVSLALATLPVGLAIGFFVALGKQSPERSVKLAANMYTTIFRGLPELLTLFVVFSSYSSEVFLSAFRAIPKGQYEGGYAIGLSNGQTMRKVILPQLIRIALPGLANLWMILLKDTALVSAIGLADILRQTGVAARVTKHAFLFFGVACMIYLVLAILSSFVIDAIERSSAKSGVKR